MSVLMKKTPLLTLLTFYSIGLYSCNGQSEPEYSQIELYRPDSMREILALNDTEFQVDISVNYGDFQTFTIDSNLSQASVNVSGVLRDEENVIGVIWSEIIGGFRIELSRQVQLFNASGSTTISAPHIFSEFDYDNDGRTNFAERLGESCVWSASENCTSTGRSETPTGNFILNGDASSGNDYWWTNNVLEEAGRHCVTTPALAPEIPRSALGYTPKFPVKANSTYTLQFEVSAQNNSTAKVTYSLPDFFDIFEESFDVSNDSQTKRIVFTNTSDDWKDVQLSFRFGDESGNRFCFDNIRVVKEQ